MIFLGPKSNDVPGPGVPPELERTKRPVRRRRLRWLVYAGAPLLFLTCLMPEWPGILYWALECTFGWARFLAMQLPHVRPSAAEAVFSVIVLSLLTGILHATARSMYGSNGRWRVRWTLGLLIVAGILFAAGTAVAGVGRHLIALGRVPVWVHDVGTSRDIRAYYYSRDHLKNIARGMDQYGEKFQRPPAGGTFDALGQPLHSWVTRLLPYLDQAPLSDRIRRDLPWSAPENQANFRTQLEIMRVPFDRAAPGVTADGYAVANYAANVHVMGPDHAVPIHSMTDGAAHTIAIGEASTNPRAWGDPRNWRDPADGINSSPASFGIPTGRRGCNFLFADGSMRFISQNTDRAVLRKLATPDGGEAIGDWDY
jgi:prepilin-type processing-associated H-X9-DG protein